MPNIQSNKKNLRKTVKRTAKNRATISRVRTQSKKMEKLIVDKKFENIDKEISVFYKLADKAVKKGVIKKNNVARKKAEITKKISEVRK